MEPAGEHDSYPAHRPCPMRSWSSFFTMVILFKPTRDDCRFLQPRVCEPVADGKTIIFLSEVIENIAKGWQAKETYRIISDNEFTETFELAPPGVRFEVYPTTHFIRVRDRIFNLHSHHCMAKQVPPGTCFTSCNIF